MNPGAVMKFGSVTYIGVNSIKKALEWPKEKEHRNRGGFDERNQRTFIDNAS